MTASPQNSTIHRQARLLLLALGLSSSAMIPTEAFAAFGLTTTTDLYTVDTGAGLVFSVRRTNPSNNTQAAGDISSIKYNGVEYQDLTRGTQINSGLGSASVSAAVVNTNFVKITVTDGAGLTHYYMARNGYKDIYMATHFTTEPSIGLVRFIVRIPSAKLPNGPVPSDIRNNTGAIEASDIFKMSNGHTRSKHYSNMRTRDWSYIGATGTNVGIWIVRDNHEGSSGGPFYRSLLNQCGTDQELTYIVNYGEAQTEAFRTGILNAYTMVFTNGGTPATNIDTSWFANMGLVGYVPPSGRGKVAGVGINGRNTAYTYTVGFANSTAQYWTTAAASNGAYTCAGMRPGTYTMTIYKNELAVHTRSVTVTAGGSVALNTIAIAGDPSSQAAIWRIGDWDGSPGGFRNAANITTMHPSDVRMASWTPGDYTVGSSSASNFPCYQWKDINGAQVVKFNLTAAQVAAHTIRVGLTCAYSGARPKISVNGWTSANPSPSTQPGSRTLTVGTYRGNNVTYTFNVPASAFVAGTNTLTIIPISGSGAAGFLSAGYSLDCVDLF